MTREPTVTHLSFHECDGFRVDVTGFAVVLPVKQITRSNRLDATRR